jgi:translation initiation factor 1 (eIF-1/SUI1)
MTCTDMRHLRVTLRCEDTYTHDNCAWCHVGSFSSKKQEIDITRETSLHGKHVLHHDFVTSAMKPEEIAESIRSNCFAGNTEARPLKVEIRPIP